MPVASNAMPCDAMSCHAMPCLAVLCHFMLCNAMSFVWFAMPRYAIVFYKILDYKENYVLTTASIKGSTYALSATLQVGLVRFLKNSPSFILLPPLPPPATPDQNSNATPDDNVKNFT